MKSEKHAQLSDACARGRVTLGEALGLREKEWETIVSLGQRALAQRRLRDAYTLARIALSFEPYRIPGWDLALSCAEAQGDNSLRTQLKEVLHQLAPNAYPTPSVPPKNPQQSHSSNADEHHTLTHIQLPFAHSQYETHREPLDAIATQVPHKPQKHAPQQTETQTAFSRRSAGLLLDTNWGDTLV